MAAGFASRGVGGRSRSRIGLGSSVSLPGSVGLCGSISLAGSIALAGGPGLLIGLLASGRLAGGSTGLGRRVSLAPFTGIQSGQAIVDLVQPDLGRGDLPVIVAFQILHLFQDLLVLLLVEIGIAAARCG